MHGTVPIVTSVKRWPDISWSLGISGLAQRLIVIVWCWLRGTIQGKFGKIRCSLSCKRVAAIGSGAHQLSKEKPALKTATMKDENLSMGFGLDLRLKGFLLKPILEYRQGLSTDSCN